MKTERKITEEQVKERIEKNLKEALVAKVRYEEAKKVLEDVEETERKIKKEILKNNIFLDKEGNRILDYRCDYEIIHNQENFNSYLKLVHKERIKNNLNLENIKKTAKELNFEEWGVSSDTVLFASHLEAKNKFLTIISNILNLDSENLIYETLQNQKKAIEIFTRLLNLN